MAEKEIEKILKEEDDYLYTDSETGIGKKSKTERILDEATGKMRRKTIGPQQVRYTDEDGNTQLKRIRGDDQGQLGRKIAKRSNKAGDNVFNFFADSVSEQQKNKSGFAGSLYRAADSVNRAVGGFIGETVSAFGNTPKFLRDAFDAKHYDNVEWGGKELKEQANKKQEEGKGRLDAWFETIAENSNTEGTDQYNLAGETLNQAINGPLLWVAGKALKLGGPLLQKVMKPVSKILSRGDDVVKTTSKVDNIVDDAIKGVNKTSEEMFEGTTKIGEHVDDVTNEHKIFSNVDETPKGSSEVKVFENGTKTAEQVAQEAVEKKQSVISKIGNWSKEKLKEGWDLTSSFILGPVKDVYNIGKAGITTAISTYRKAGIGSAIIEGLTETATKSLDFASDFATRPLSFRTPKIWEAKVSSDFLGGTVERGVEYFDSKSFYNDHGYSLENVSLQPDDDSLTEWYDKNNIDEDKRLSKKEIDDLMENMGRNGLTDSMEEWYKQLSLFDIFSAPAAISSYRRGEDVEVEKNSRGETIGIVTLSDGTTVDLSDLENITAEDKDGNPVGPDDISEDTLAELESIIIEKFGSEDEEESQPQGYDDDGESNQLMTQINTRATDGMINAETMYKIVNGKNTSKNDVWIATKMQEGTKQYVSTIVAMYTKEELEKDPQLQREVVNYLNAYSKLFNGVVDIINELDESVYDKDVYTMRKTLSESYNRLSAKDKDLINGNLYRKAVDYNNSLESGIDESLMKSATRWKRVVDGAYSLIKSDDRSMWFDQGLQGLGTTLINPDTHGWSSLFNSVGTHLESQEATITTTLIINKINNSIIEKIPAKGIDSIIKKNPKLNTKWMNAIKGGSSEMASEFGENFIDQVSMVDSPDHDYDYWNGLLFGMFQGGLAGYAGSNNSHDSINSYFSNPDNRKTILENMGIYIDSIEDPQKRAVALSITNQMFDNIINIMKDVAASINNGVEAIMQGYAVYQTESMLSDYAADVIGQMIDAVNNKNKQNGGKRTEADILQIFDTVKDFENYNAGKSFSFNENFVNYIKNKQSNVDKLNSISKVAYAYIESSFKTAGMSLEDGINYMAPKIYEASGKKISTPLFNKKISDNQIIDSLTGNPYYDLVTIYAGTNQIAPTIGEKLGITKDNEKVYGEHKRTVEFGGFKLKLNSLLQIKTKTKGYKPTVTLDNGKEVSMREYIIQQLNDPNNNLTPEERNFIATILFKTTVSGYNHYFNDDGSLSRLGEDFFEQVIPQLEGLSNPNKLFNKLNEIQRLKEVESETSERKALNESQANQTQVDIIRLEGGTSIKNGDDISNIPDSQPLPIEKDGQTVNMQTLRDAGSLEVKDGDTKLTYTIDHDGTSETLTITKETTEQTEGQSEAGYILKKGGAGTTTVTDNSISTREVNVPVSARSMDYPELKEGQFKEAHELLASQDAAKKDIPYLDQTKITVGIEDGAQGIGSFEATSTDLSISADEINKEYYWKNLPIVEIDSKDEDGNPIVKRYRAVWIGDSAIKDKNNSKGKKRDFIFKSFALVDFEGGERVNKYKSKAIRPTEFPTKYVFYSDNNTIIEVIGKDGKPLDENRVIMFTKGNKKGQDRQVWRMSTTVQYDRLSEHDQDIAFSKTRVFMNENNSDPKTHKKGFLGPQEVTYDARYIYTTSDLIFDKNNLRFRMGDVNVDLSTKDYNVDKLSWKLNEQETETLQSYLKKLWNATKHISSDGATQIEKSSEPKTTTDTVIEDMEQEESAEPVEEEKTTTKKKTPQQVKNELRTVDKTVEQQYNYGLEKAKADNANPTKSVAESAMDNISHIQTSLFGGPSLDSIKSSVEDHLNQLIKISLNEDDINDRIKNIEEDIEDLENENEPDQEDIDSLNAEKNNLANQIETLSTFQKIVDESEEFDTVEQYLNNELDRLKEGDTNTIMDMASKYGILEGISNTTTPIVQEQVSDQQQVQAPEGIKTIQTTQSELDYIKAEAIKNGTFMKAPNGKPSNLSEANWLQVRTKDFKEWFGDWENDPKNASKVVDENGEPLLVYHGGARGIERFRLPTSGEESNTGYGTYTDRETGEVIPIDSNRAIFFSDRYGVSRYYASLYGINDMKYIDRLVRGLQGAVLGEKRGTIHPLISQVAKERGLSAKEGMIMACDFLISFEPGFADVKERLLSGKKLTKEEGKQIDDRIRAITLTDNYKEANDDQSLIIYEHINSLTNSLNFLKEYNNPEGIKKLKNGEIPEHFKKTYDNKAVNKGLGVYQDFGDETEGDFFSGIYMTYGEQTKDGINENLRIHYGGSSSRESRYIKELSEKQIKELLDHLTFTTERQIKYYRSKPYLKQFEDRSQIYSAFLNIRNPLSHDYEGSGIGIGVGYKGNEKMPTGYVNARQVNKAIKDGNDGVIYENMSDPYLANSYGVFDPDNIRFAVQQVTDDYGNVITQEEINKNTSELEAIVDNTTVESLPDTNELLTQTSTSNEEVASNHLSSEEKIAQLAEDCRKLHITLDALNPQQLAIVIKAYEQGLGINYVIEQFSKDLLTSKVDFKLVNALIKKGILRDDVEYDKLTISQMINYTSLIDEQNKNNIYKMVDPNDINPKTGWAVLDELTKYYIRNYFNYNPATIDSKLKYRIRKMIEAKLLDSDIFIAKEKTDALNVKDDLQTVLSIEKLNPELKKSFAIAAHDLGLISDSRYNYLMGTNPYITNIDNGAYNPGIIASTFIKSMNSIPEFAAFDSKTANKHKIQLIWDIYNYFSIINRGSSYEGLIKYLNRVHKRSGKEMKAMIDVLAKDMEDTLNPIHSEEVMNSFWDISVIYEDSPYEIFIKDKGDNEDAIVEALVELEKEDVPSFLQIMRTAPGSVRRELYQRFYQDNKLNHGRNLAYGLVSMLLTNYQEVENALKDEKQSKALSEDALYLLRNFDRRALINPLVTQQLIKELGIHGLNPNLGTVILTDNFQDSLGRGMQNFDNVKRFELLPVASLSSLKMNVNVIVPKGVSIPKIKEGSFNIVKVNEAGYKNGAMVIKTYDGSSYDMSNRVFNIMGVNGLGIEYKKGGLTEEQKQTLIKNKESKPLYWNIFKYNIMPNLGPNQQNITQEEFEAMIDTNTLKEIKDTTLFNTFAAKNLNELVDASVRIINKITNSQLGLQSNLQGGRKSVAVKTSVDQFVKFVIQEFVTSTEREQVIQMFSEYLMMQLKTSNIDRGQWFHDFCERHDSAIRLLYKKFIDRSESGGDISSLFINKDETNETNEADQNVSDTVVKDMLSKQIEKFENEKKDLEKQLSNLKDDGSDRYQIQAQNIRTEIDRLNGLIESSKENLKLSTNIEEDEEDIRYGNDTFIDDVMEDDSMRGTEIDIEQANNSTVVTSEYETLGAYEDKAVKVLHTILEDFIEPNTISVGESNPDNIRNTRLISKGLLNIVTGGSLFSTQNVLKEDLSTKDVNEYQGRPVFSTNRRLDISNKDLMALQGMLVTLKETNPDKFKETLDKIIVIQENVGYEVISDIAQNEKLKRLKNELYNNPAKLYSIMSDLLNDNTLGVDVYYGIEYEKSNKYQGINIKGLLNNIAQEYYDTRPQTATSENVGQLHEMYDKYFEIKVDGKDVKPSDEQVNALNNLINMYNNRTSGGTLAIPGIAGTGKTTLLTAFFNYIMEQGGAAQEVDNIAGKKQTVFINNFSPSNSKILDQVKGDNNDHYIRVYNEKSGGDVYIKFKGNALIPHYKLEESYNNAKDKEGYLSKLSERLGGLRSNEGLMAMAEIGDDKYKDTWSRYTWMINNFEVVTKDQIPSGVKVLDIPGRQQVLRPRKGQKFDPIQNQAKGLNDISFAVRMHSTVGSLKDVFVSQGGLAGLDIATIDSYLIQENTPLINDFGYETTYHIKSNRDTEGRVIIIDEAQNAYNANLQALVEQLSEKNVIVFLGDYHQMSKGDFLKTNSDGTLYMIETHRGTDDINMLNDIMSFSQGALINSNAIGIYLKDSEDFVKYNNSDIEKLIPTDIKNTLMVCAKNDNRKAMNDLYIEKLGGMDNIIKNGNTIQAMIVDIESSERSQRNRKSEIPDEGLKMTGFKKYQGGNWYYRYNGNGIDIFFPSTKQTDTSDSDISRALDTVHGWTNKRTGLKYGKQENGSYGGDISLYVPAFAITTEKESGKTVNNIILHEDITNTEYDFLSEKNVKQYYDAFTRGSKKVYIPQKSTRLIGITKKQAKNLRDGKGLTSATIMNQKESISVDSVNIPSINNGSWNSSKAIDTMLGVINTYFSVLGLPISDLIDELNTIRDMMNGMYLQNALVSADIEAMNHGVGKNNEFVNNQISLQYRAAEIWDTIFNMIKDKNEYINKLNSEFGGDPKYVNTLEYINGKVYGQTIKVPYIKNGVDRGKTLLYGQKKYANKKLDIKTLKSILIDSDTISEGSLLEGTLYQPVTKKDKSGKFYTTLKPVEVKRETKNKKGWLNFGNNGFKSADDYSKMIQNVNEMFDPKIDINNREGTTEAFEKAMEKENERIFDNIDYELGRIWTYMEDNDLQYVKDIIASNQTEDEYKLSQLQQKLDSAIEIAKDRKAEDLNELKGLIIELNGYLIAYDNGEIRISDVESSLDTRDDGVAFNVTSAQDTIDQEFTCE